MEDTGIEFRSYSVGDTSETPEINEDIGIEQEEGSEFQIDAKKKKKPKPFVHRDCIISFLIWRTLKLN